MGMGGGLGNKSPNLQANPNASMANNMGGGGPMGNNSMVMSIASNGNQQPMSSMQGKDVVQMDLILGVLEMKRKVWIGSSHRRIRIIL